MRQVLTNKKSYFIFFLVAIIHDYLFAQQGLLASLKEPGVTEQLAKYRTKYLSDVHYELAFSIPEKKINAIEASELIGFNLKSGSGDLLIDFKEKPDHLLNILLNNHQIAVIFNSEHISIARKYLKTGINNIRIKFIAGNLSMNRNDDYLYTLLVPDRARTVFPCFDQPDLKASFLLSLTVPETWNAIANAPIKDTLIQSGLKTYHFENSDKISTYLFSFAAGNFKNVSDSLNGRPMVFLHRETDTAKINYSVPSIFKIQADAISFMEHYTQIKYPFKKFDFVAIPDFQYGGMEHVGAIQYKASSLFLDQGATREEELSRSNLLSHETAHMWFGDLVTMRWFNDVWMKEVFANFMADKITNVAVANNNYDLKFLIDHYPAAYSIDRTKGANPIRQKLDNLQDAGSLYGNIIYHKAPIMMRQLERRMGAESFRNGLSEYLKTYAHGNASWPELINILNKHSKHDLKSWNKVWVNETGRPEFSYQVKRNKNNIISDMVINQKAEDGSARIWPQIFEMAFIYPDHIQQLTVNMNSRSERIREAAGKICPIAILFNSTGQGYGIFPVDTSILLKTGVITDPVQAASMYINLYENMLNGRSVTPKQLFNFYRNIITTEKEELNLRLITGQLSDIFWRLMEPRQRLVLGSDTEKDLWQAMQNETAPNKKKILLKTFQGIATTGPALDSLYTIWKNEITPEGIKYTEEDYTSLAFALAVRNYRDTSILTKQLSRIKNQDRRKRLLFIMPAVSADVQTRDSFFYSLQYKKNREKEAWVATALSYLHHPLRLETSRKYLRHSLEWLQEIQLTGDIFFPQAWLQATFGNYQDHEAAEVVRNFLNNNKNYNPKLRAKILQSADPLFRAERLLAKAKGENREL